MPREQTNPKKKEKREKEPEVNWELTLVFLGTVAAFTGLQAGLALPAHASPVLRSVRAQLALAPVARVLLLLSPAARELVGVQDVQHGERRGPVAGRALANTESGS